MNIKQLRKISMVRGILLSKGFIIIPQKFKVFYDVSESFVNGKFRVDVYDDGKIESYMEHNNERFLSLCKDFWLKIV